MIIALFAGGAVALGLFCWAETRAAEPMLPMRLFRNPVFAVCSVLSFIVGFAMLGALTFLPTYLQYVDGDSATVSGVRMLPMVIGLLLASIGSGTAVSRTGQYRLFPIVGTLVMAVGLYLLSRLEPGTGTALASFYMFVLGVGIGLSMQVLTIAVQNTVDYADLGTATSGVTFFRTIGSSFGTAVFGTIYANSLKTELAKGVAVSARLTGADPALIARAAESPQGLHGLPAAQAAPIVQGYSDALHTVFLWTVPVALVGFVVALFLKQVQLRDTARAGSTDIGEGFAQPTTSDSDPHLEFAVGKLVRGVDLDTVRTIVDDADTRVDLAGAWALMEVAGHTKAVGQASLDLIATRKRVPPEVLEPVFDRMAAEGYLTRDGDRLSPTEAGTREVRALARAWSDWLNARLDADAGRPRSAQLRTAADAIAWRLMIEDLANGLPSHARSKVTSRT